MRQPQRSQMFRFRSPHRGLAFRRLVVVADQAALYGLIGKARNLGLTLVAVCQVAATDATTEPSDGQI